MVVAYVRPVGCTAFLSSPFVFAEPRRARKKSVLECSTAVRLRST